MNLAMLNQPFFQITLPLLIGIFIASWLQNKRFDDVNKRIDEIIKRLDRIEALLQNHENRIIKLELERWK
jgi:hypothetical protein